MLLKSILQKRFSFTNMLLTGTVAALFCTSSLALQVTGSPDDDQRFLALRDAASKEDAKRAAELASQLASYPLTSYVDYYQLKAHLRSANTAEITDFLSRYANSAIADRLRNDWLLLLGRQSNWVSFDEQYPQFVLNDDMQLKCYALLSKFKQGQNVANDARNLLTSSRVYGEGCYPLFTNLVQSGQFSQTDMWNQIRWAAEAKTTSVAIQLATLANLPKTAKALDIPTTKTAERLKKALAKSLAKSNEAHQTALILLGRLAKEDPYDAVAALNNFEARLSDDERAIAWAQIALPASHKLLPETLEYWKKTDNAPISNDAYPWRVRIALRNTDWKLVRSYIEAMPITLQSDAAWVYWLGRSYVAENKADIAQPFFQSIAGQFNFYGQLALEERGLQITAPTLTPITALDINAVSNNPGLQQALQFFAMNLRFEGTREWNWQLRTMSERQLLAAAEFARQNNILDRMVSTSDRTKFLFDFTQRFPTPHKEVMAQTTDALNLDMAWVYGLIRQESRFILNARSSVGASGLMQIMPGTAKYVVRKMKLDNIDLTRVNNIDTNIVLGANYLSIILNDLNNSQVLASAGYNAGPNRARAWRASLPATLEGAIFAETIPFTETRDYVKNVMSNATYYAALFKGAPQSLKTRLGFIAPADAQFTATPDATPANQE
jgi:soluble lytic murein transglycosylase